MMVISLHVCTTVYEMSSTSQLKAIRDSEPVISGFHRSPPCGLLLERCEWNEGHKQDQGSLGECSIKININMEVLVKEMKTDKSRVSVSSSNCVLHDSIAAALLVEGQTDLEGTSLR